MIENMTDDSIYEVYRRAVAHFGDGSVFVEVGCYYGNSVIFLAREVMLSSKNIRVFAVDTFRYNDVDIYPGFIAKIQGGLDLIGVIRKDSVFAVRDFKRGKVDFVYIDADHRYEYVLQDIKAWLPKIKKGGWIGGHDYNDDGVKKAVNEIFDSVETVKTDSWLVKL